MRNRGKGTGVDDSLDRSGFLYRVQDVTSSIQCTVVNLARTIRIAVAHRAPNLQYRGASRKYFVVAALTKQIRRSQLDASRRSAAIQRQEMLDLVRIASIGNTSAYRVPLFNQRDDCVRTDVAGGAGDCYGTVRGCYSRHRGQSVFEVRGGAARVYLP